MKRQIVIVSFLAATLIFLIKLFEVRFLTSQISIKIYIFIIGAIFLSIGIWIGLRSGKKKVLTKSSKGENKIKIKLNTPQFLTTRETELLALIAAGLSNKEMADRLFVSEHTIKKHLNNLYAKLAVSRRTQAILKAKELGIF